MQCIRNFSDDILPDMLSKTGKTKVQDDITTPAIRNSISTLTVFIV